MLDVSGRQPEPSTPAASASVDDTRRRPIRLIGVLLLFQATGLASIGAYELAQLDWHRAGTSAMSQQVIRAAVPLFFAVPAGLALLAALAFLFMSRRGWVPAATAQGLGLGGCLWLYSAQEPAFYVYLTMVYCILMILLLNTHDVRTAFHLSQPPAEHNPEVTRGT